MSAAGELDQAGVAESATIRVMVQTDPVAGSIGLLDEQCQPVGDTQQCRFRWATGPGSWSVQLVTDHTFDLQETTVPVWFIAIYDDQRVLYMFPVVGRPLEDAGTLRVGPRY